MFYMWQNFRDKYVFYKKELEKSKTKEDTIINVNAKNIQQTPEKSTRQGRIETLLLSSCGAFTY